MLSFISSSGKGTFEIVQLKSVFERLKEKSDFAIWSGGVSVSQTTGEFQIKNTDNFVESEIQLSSDIFKDSASFFSKLSEEMSALDSLATKAVYYAVSRFYSDLKMDGMNIAANASNLFWQQCEGVFQRIVDACFIENTDQYNQEMAKINNQIWQFVKQTYNQYCPNQSARQLEVWAKNFPKKFEKKRLS